MHYLIIRLDGQKDEITAHVDDTYEDAYEVVENILSDLCCSDADYGDRPYYDIIEVTD